MSLAEDSLSEEDYNDDLLSSPNGCGALKEGIHLSPDVIPPSPKNTSGRVNPPLAIRRLFEPLRDSSNSIARYVPPLTSTHHMLYT